MNWFLDRRHQMERLFRFYFTRGVSARKLFKQTKIDHQVLQDSIVQNKISKLSDLFIVSLSTKKTFKKGNYSTRVS